MQRIGSRVQNSAPLLHQRRSALTDFLERHFEAAKFLRAQLREDLPHLPGMLSEGWSNEIPAARCERNEMQQIGEAVARAIHVASGRAGTLRLGFTENSCWRGVVPESFRRFRECNLTPNSSFSQRLARSR